MCATLALVVAPSVAAADVPLPESPPLRAGGAHVATFYCAFMPCSCFLDPVFLCVPTGPPSLPDVVDYIEYLLDGGRCC